MIRTFVGYTDIIKGKRIHKILDKLNLGIQENGGSIKSISMTSGYVVNFLIVYEDNEQYEKISEFLDPLVGINLKKWIKM